MSDDILTTPQGSIILGDKQIEIKKILDKFSKHNEFCSIKIEQKAESGMFEIRFLDFCRNIHREDIIMHPDVGLLIKFHILHLIELELMRVIRK